MIDGDNRLNFRGAVFGQCPSQRDSLGTNCDAAHGGVQIDAREDHPVPQAECGPNGMPPRPIARYDNRRCLCNKFCVLIHLPNPLIQNHTCTLPRIRATVKHAYFVQVRPMKPLFLPVVTMICLAQPLHADEAQDFITANVISTIYHEFAHALIDLTDAPVEGQEEAAADILSIMLLDAFWEDDSAQSITALTALSFELAVQEAEDPAHWAAHELDLERYYNLVCLFYGADPETRAMLAEDFELPAPRAKACVEEFTRAASIWTGILDPLTNRKPEQSIAFTGDTSTDVKTLLAAEAAALNDTYDLPQPISIKLESCGAENAFYDAATASITVCTEFVAFLERQVIANDL